MSPKTKQSMLKHAPEDKLGILALGAKMEILACPQDQSHKQKQRGWEKGCGNLAKAIMEEMHKE